jgi:hypothetical protein
MGETLQFAETQETQLKDGIKTLLAEMSRVVEPSSQIPRLEI